MKSPDHELGYRIKAACEEKHLAQEKLEEIIEITANYMAEIENKQAIPSFAILYSICITLNISIGDQIFQTNSNMILKITRQRSQCNEKLLHVISVMIECYALD